METLIEIAVGIVGAAGAVFLFRLLNPKTNVKENQQVIVKIDQISKENEELLNTAKKNIDSANKKVEELEKEKQKDPSTEQLEDFFNTRKH